MQQQKGSRSPTADSLDGFSRGGHAALVARAPTLPGAAVPGAHGHKT